MTRPVFSSNRPLPSLLPGQTATVRIFDMRTGQSTPIHTSAELLLEAPNWLGEDLIINGAGRFWRLPVDGSSAPIPLDFEGLPRVNNDHVLAPDGSAVYASAYDWHIHRASLADGTASRVTSDTVVDGRTLLHFLHGISPDGASLAFVGIEADPDGTWATANIFTVPSAGGPVRQLTHDTVPADGCEFSPDGDWIYFNTEAFTRVPGHAQLARMRTDGSELTQLTFDGRVNWFPHLSPDGSTLVYLSFEPGTQGHPANHEVELRALPVDANPSSTAKPRTLASLFGGQGTINVNSWAPDGTRFAYVEYSRVPIA